MELPPLMGTLVGPGIGKLNLPQPHSDGQHFVRQRRRSWARLLKKIYEVDPLRCTHCGSEMQIIAWIEQSEVIRKILRHLDLWERPQRSPPPKLFPHKLKHIRTAYGNLLSRVWFSNGV